MMFGRFLLKLFCIKPKGSEKVNGFAVFLIFAIGVCTTQNADSQLQSAHIDQIKAAFILNIVRFVSWPDEVYTERIEYFSLCLYGENPVNKALFNIKGKKVGGRVLNVTQVESFAESNSCHALVLSDHVLEKFREDVYPGLQRPILTIADFTNREESHTMHQDILVALVRNGARIGFQINLNKSREVGLWMSSKLLKLATIVGEEG